MTKLTKKIFLTIIWGYQKLISPLLPARCRYYPTCSHYGLQAIAWHGAKRGVWLTIKRICRCHPLGGHGVDFVPLPLYHFKFQYFKEPTVKNGIVETDQFMSTSTKPPIETTVEPSRINYPIRSNFVYIDHSDYSHQLNQWLKKPIIDKH